MNLSSDLISQFVKATKDDKKVSNEATVFGTIVYDGKPYVKLDGSDLLTPVTTTTDVVDEERVTVMIKDHSAIITGNMSSPSARTDDLKETAAEIAEFGTMMAYTVSTENLSAINAAIENLKVIAADITDLESVHADIENLQAKFASLDKVTAKDVEIITADIESLRATFGNFTDVSTEDLEAVNAEIDNLKAYTANFTYVSADNLNAIKADVKRLDVEKLNAEQADLKYVNIDFANIDKAWMDEFYAKSGLIENVTMGDGTVTGYLVGVTIKADTIEGNTIVADKLVVQGEDGLYYKLNTDGVTTKAEQTEYNSLNGSILTAKSVTAEKISVNDLVAFGATIGGFNITDSSLYSGVKDSVINSARGVYLDNDGQFYLGDSDNYLKFYKVVNENGEPILDEDGNPTYKLEISADSISFGSDSRSSAADLKALTEHVKIGTIVDEETGDEKPCVELSEGDSDFKQVITNTKTMFMDGADVKTEIDAEGVSTESVAVRQEFRHAGFVWAKRTNGNYGLSWKGVTS